MRIFWKFILFFLISIGIILHYSLLVLKIDRNISISNYTVNSPALIIYGSTMLIMIFETIHVFIHKSKNLFINTAIFQSIGFVSLGSFITLILLSAKVEMDIESEFFFIILPFLISVVIAFFIIAWFLSIKSRQKRKKLTLLTKNKYKYKKIPKF